MTERSSGRFTPKGGKKPPAPAPPEPEAGGRYTPPTPKEFRESPKWLLALMIVFFVGGTAVIILNYLPGAPLLPGDSSNWTLLGGLGLITLGFITATKWQ